MPGYRLYLFDRSTGHIADLREFSAADDIAASTFAEACRWTGAAELWQRARMVKRWEGPSQQRAI